MTMEYIRKKYNVPANRGGRISFTNAEKAVQGSIVGSRGDHLRIRMDGSKMTHTLHPTWHIVYLTPNKQ